jgi:hypothetical protein
LGDVVTMKTKTNTLNVEKTAAQTIRLLSPAGLLIQPQSLQSNAKKK